MIQKLTGGEMHRHVEHLNRDRKIGVLLQQLNQFGRLVIQPK